MDDEQLIPPSEKPKSRSRKVPEWKSLPDAQKAQYLLDHQTLSDRTWTWTDKQRLTGEKRDAFIRRILLGETGEIYGGDTDATTSTDEIAAQARTPAAAASGAESVVEQLEALGVRGILWRLARDGQISVLLLPRS